MGQGSAQVRDKFSVTQHCKETSSSQISSMDVRPDWVELVEIDGKKYEKIYMSPKKLSRKFEAVLDLTRYKGYYYQAVLPNINLIADSIAADPLVDSVQVIDSMRALIWIEIDNYILKYGSESLDPEDGEYSGYRIYILPLPAPYLPINSEYPNNKPEILNLRTPYSRTFFNDDGSYTSILTIRPTSFPIKDGKRIKWVEILPENPIPDSVVYILDQEKDQTNWGVSRYVSVIELDNDGQSAYNYIYGGGTLQYVNLGAGKDMAGIHKHLYQRVCSQFSTTGFPQDHLISNVKYRTYVTAAYPEDYQINSDGTYDSYKIRPIMRDFHHNLISYNNGNYNDLYNDIGDGDIYYYQESDYWLKGAEYVYATFNINGRNNVIARISDGYYSTGLKDSNEDGSSNSIWEAIVIKPFADQLQITHTWGIEEDEDTKIPEAFYLSQNIPNPLTSTTSIQYAIPQESSVCLRIYNISGQVVATLVNEVKKPGFYTYIWNSLDQDCRRLVPGVYFYHLESEEFKSTRKMILLR